MFTRHFFYQTLCGWKGSVSDGLVMKSLILTGGDHLCVVAVTLLDSMSALADLGWEAYPNEGVSMTRTDTHTHKSFTQKENI